MGIKCVRLIWHHKNTKLGFAIGAEGVSLTKVDNINILIQALYRCVPNARTLMCETHGQIFNYSRFTYFRNMVH